MKLFTICGVEIHIRKPWYWADRDQLTCVDTLTRRQRSLFGVIEQIKDEARGEVGSVEIDMAMYPPEPRGGQR